MLVSYSFCKNLSQTWWIKTKEIHSLTVFEARCLKLVSLGHKQYVSRVVFPLDGQRENPFLNSSSFWNAAHDHISPWLLGS